MGNPRMERDVYMALCAVIVIGASGGDAAALATKVREVCDALPDDARTGFKCGIPALRAAASKVEAWANRTDGNITELTAMLAEAEAVVNERKAADADRRAQELAETGEQVEPGEQSQDIAAEEGGHATPSEPDEFGDEVHDPGGEHGNAVEDEVHAA